MSIHTLTDEESEKINNIVQNIGTKNFKNKLRESMQDAIDEELNAIEDYIKDEFSLRFDEFVVVKAKSIVESLLRGESLESFGLDVHQDYFNREPFVVSGRHCRDSIVEDFAEQIKNAYVLELEKQNENLKRDIEFLKIRH